MQCTLRLAWAAHWVGVQVEACRVAQLPVRLLLLCLVAVLLLLLDDGASVTR